MLYEENNQMCQFLFDIILHLHNFRAQTPSVSIYAALLVDGIILVSFVYYRTTVVLELGTIKFNSTLTSD